jgi:hypothetical protein
VGVEGHRDENNFMSIRHMVVSSKACILLGGKAARGPCRVSDGVGDRTVWWRSARVCGIGLGSRIFPSSSVGFGTRKIRSSWGLIGSDVR